MTLTDLVGAYPRGTASALGGFVTVLCYYLLARKAALRNPARFRGSLAYPASDSRFWTSRPYLLIGISLTFASIALASLADGIEKDSHWAIQLFLATAMASGCCVLVVGCIYLLRHWKEVIADFREPPSDYFGTLTNESEPSERYELAPLRVPLLKKCLWLGCGLLLLMLLASKLGIAPERVLENPLVAFVTEHLFWIAIVTLLIVLWTTRNRFVLMLRAMVLLVFSAVISTALGFLLLGFGYMVAPALTTVAASIIALNFVFYRWIERVARIPGGAIQTQCL